MKPPLAGVTTHDRQHDIAVHDADTHFAAFGIAGSIGNKYIAIMDAAYRGRGLGTEALRQAAEYAFRELEVSHLVLTVFPDNTPSMRSYEKLGFETTEILKESWELPDETFADMCVMELTREAFENVMQRAGSSVNSL